MLRLPVVESLRDSNSRFGETRLQVAEKLRQEIDPAALGMRVLPVKRLGLAASAGTTPFGGLFLGFSFFLIAAAVMLVALLFQLGIQQRAAELGTLAAVGVGRRRISRLLGGEGAVVAAAGAMLGVVAGMLYAWLMVYGLRTWWLAAVSTPFLRLHVAAASLVIGWLVGVVVSLVRDLVVDPETGAGAGGTAAFGGSGGRPGLGCVFGLASPTLRRRVFSLLRWPILRVVFLVLAVVQCVAGFLHAR